MGGFRTGRRIFEGLGKVFLITGLVEKSTGSGKLSFVVFIWFSKSLSLLKGIANFRDTYRALGNSLSVFLIHAVVP